MTKTQIFLSLSALLSSSRMGHAQPVEDMASHTVVGMGSAGSDNPAECDGSDSGLIQSAEAHADADAEKQCGGSKASRIDDYKLTGHRGPWGAFCTINAQATYTCPPPLLSPSSLVTAIGEVVTGSANYFFMISESDGQAEVATAKQAAARNAEEQCGSNAQQITPFRDDRTGDVFIRGTVSADFRCVR